MVTMQYGRDAQLLPFVIGIPSALLVLGVLAIQLLSMLTEFEFKTHSGSLFALPEDETASSEPLEDRTARGRQLLAVSDWLVSLTVAIFLFGMLASRDLFFLGFYRFHAGQS